MESKLSDKELALIKKFWIWFGTHRFQLQSEIRGDRSLHYMERLRTRLKALSANLQMNFGYNDEPHMYFLVIGSDQPDADRELVEAINSSFPGFDRWDNRLWARYLELRLERQGPDYELNFESFCRRLCSIRYRVDKVFKETRQMSIALFLPNYRFHLDQDYSMQVGRDFITLMLGDGPMKDGVILSSMGPLPKEEEELFYLVELAQHADYLRPL